MPSIDASASLHPLYVTITGDHSKCYFEQYVADIRWPGMAGASGAVARAPRQPHHVTTWFTPRQPHANRPFPIGEILGNLSPLFNGARFFPITIPSASSVTASSLFPHPPAPLSGSSEIGGVRAGARESPGQLWILTSTDGPPFLAMHKGHIFGSIKLANVLGIKLLLCL